MQQWQQKQNNGKKSVGTHFSCEQKVIIQKILNTHEPTIYMFEQNVGGNVI
jgi:hypothetical protein